MSYLARLKDARLANMVTVATDKADKSPSVSFVSTHGRRISELIGSLSTATSALADASVAVASLHGPHTGAHYRWRLTFTDRPRLEVCSLPEMTAAEVIARYPGAIVELAREGIL